GGPYPIGNYGLGEPVVFVFMGPVMVMATYYVQAQEITLAPFVASLPVAFVVTAILHCNNIRDVEEDRASGKRSIAAWIGLTPSRWLYAGMLAGAYISIAAAVATDVLGPWALLGLLPLPWAAIAVQRLFVANERPAMNMLLVRSGKLHGLTGASLASGLFLNAIL
ncbi:MAG: prenyltransferase, partial [Dehalococcoidia bacterium]